MAQKIKKDDKVRIIAGKDKGKEGTVTAVFSSQRKVIVDGLNRLKKHRKKTDKADGAIVEYDAPIDISNVAVLCPKKNVPTKIGFTLLKDGTKKRVAKVSGETF